MSTAAALFWISAAFIAYTYLGYPVAIYLVSRLRRTPSWPAPENDQLPPVTVVLAAYNESRDLPGKIDNLRAQNYPQDRLQILVVSDGSTDDTASRVQGLPGVRLLWYAQRRGKAHALNVALAQVNTEFTVFCDVRQTLAPDCLRDLLGNFRDPAVGAVSGELVHRPACSTVGRSIGLYWRYEKWIRKSESRLDSTLGATGALYAIRTCDFHPLPPGTLLDDFEIPMGIVRAGKRTIFDSRAQVFDVVQERSETERKRKIRTLTGNFQSFFRSPWLFSPLANRLWLQFISHKVFRLLIPYALAIELVSSVLATGTIYRVALILQVLFYAAALCGRFTRPGHENRVIGFARTFVDMNGAAVIALFKFAASEVDGRWEKT